jgi:hypothetical protein
MNAIASVARSAYYFFVEDGSVAIGALIALVLVGVLAHAAPSTATVVGPLLFVLIAALLVANLLRVAQNARAGK